MNIMIVGLKCGYPKWLEKVLEFVVRNKLETRVHISDDPKKIIVVMRVRTHEEEAMIKENFPIQAEFERDRIFSMGGSVLIADCKVEHNSTNCIEY